MLCFALVWFSSVRFAHKCYPFHHTVFTIDTFNYEILVNVQSLMMNGKLIQQKNKNQTKRNNNGEVEGILSDLVFLLITFVIRIYILFWYSNRQVDTKKFQTFFFISSLSFSLCHPYVKTLDWVCVWWVFIYDSCFRMLCMVCVLIVVYAFLCCINYLSCWVYCFSTF